MKRLFLLLSITISALWFANFSAVERRNQPITTTDRDQILLAPKLTSHLDDIKQIEISKEGQSPIIITLNKNNQWQVKNNNNYPAKTALVRKMLRELSESALLEEKSGNEALWPHMGLDNAHAIRIKLISDDSNAPVLDVYIGEFKQMNGGTYIRHAMDKQAWLASGEFTPKMDVSYWLKQELFSIDQRRLRTVKATHISATGITQTITQSRNSPHEDMHLVDKPAWSEAPNEYNAQMILAGFDDLIMNRVILRRSVESPRVKFLQIDAETFDGLVVSIYFSGEDENWAHISAQYDATKRWTPPPSSQTATKTITPLQGYDSDVDKDSHGYDGLEGMDQHYMLPEATVKKEAKTIHDRTKKWAYVLPPYKYSMFARSPASIYGDNPELAQEDEQTTDPANSISSVETPDLNNSKQVGAVLQNYGVNKMPHSDAQKSKELQKSLQEIFKPEPLIDEEAEKIIEKNKQQHKKTTPNQ